MDSYKKNSAPDNYPVIRKISARSNCKSDNNDCMDDIIKKDSDIRFDNMIIKGINALNNRKYKEEKEISDDE